MQTAKQIVKNEGWYALLKQGFSGVYGLLLTYGTYFIVEFDYTGQQEIPDIKPRINCVYKPITSIAEFEQLVAQGYDFESRAFRPKLKKGAIAFCLFVDKTLVAETWAAANASAKKAIDPIPYRVDYERGEVCIGVRFTNPKYRNNGLSEYVYVTRLPYLKDNHFTKGKASVNVNNKISQRMNSKFSGENIAKGRYIRLLFWHYWKEHKPKYKSATSSLTV